jgi:hypothetical protein
MKLIKCCCCGITTIAQGKDTLFITLCPDCLEELQGIPIFIDEKILDQPDWLK